MTIVTAIHAARLQALSFYWCILNVSLKLVSFDPFRTLGIDKVKIIKPEHMFAEREAIRQADWVLFPEEWQVNAILHTLKTRIFPSVASYRFGQDKTQFTRAMWMAFPELMPQTMILPATEEGINQVLEAFLFPMVVKKPRSSMGQGVYKVTCRSELRNLLSELDVLYVQEYLEISRDLRVVWIGDRVVSAYWRTGGDGFHHNIARGGEVEYADIPSEALALVQKVATTLGIDHAGFDLVNVDGQWVFFEANVRFGTAGLVQSGIKTGPLIMDWLIRNSPGFDDPDNFDHPDEPPEALTA